MTPQEIRRKLATSFALIMSELDPRLPESARKAFLEDMIVKSARAIVELNGGATQAEVSAVFDRIDGDVRAILAEMPANPAGAVN